MAFVAIDGNGEIMGVSPVHSDSLYETAEYAILVASGLKGKGLGWSLMQLLVDYARAEGLKSLNGQVLCENTTMLAMCRELGFQISSCAENAGIAIVWLNLAAKDEPVEVPDRHATA